MLDLISQDLKTSSSQISAPKNVKNAFSFKGNNFFLCFYDQQLLMLKFKDINHFEIAYGS